MFVKFSCGCIGLNVQNEEGQHIILYPCDLSGNDCWEPLGFGWRNMHGKGHEPLPPEKVAEMVGDLNCLVGDGYRFRQVRRLMGFNSPNPAL